MPVDAYSLNMTEFNWEADDTFPWLLINRFVIVSTYGGQKSQSERGRKLERSALDER